MEGKGVNVTTLGTPGPDSPTPMQFAILVFHRENDVTVVALLPRSIGGLEGTSEAQVSDSEIPNQQIRRLMSLFMRSMLSRISDEEKQFWEQAMETQIDSMPIPTSQKCIDGLPTKHIQPFQQILSDRCTICQETYKVGDKITNLPCKHTFHKDCLLPWLRQRNTCPLCRHKLDSGDEKGGNIEEASGNALIEMKGAIESEHAPRPHPRMISSAPGLATSQPLVAWLESKTRETKLNQAVSGTRQTTASSTYTRTSGSVSNTSAPAGPITSARILPLNVPIHVHSTPSSEPQPHRRLGRSRQPPVVSEEARCCTIS